MTKQIAILGSTGSIGESTLKVVRHLGPEKIRVGALAAKSNIDLLEKQALEFFPELIAVYDKGKAQELQRRLPHVKVVGGLEGIQAVASYPSVNQVVSAMSGTLGLVPTVTAIQAKKDIALANKEVLISGGAFIMSLVQQAGIQLIPVDSEHSAIFQCLQGQQTNAIERIILTASGGPFRNFTPDQFESISVESALKHPNWNMGPKITIDSSTLMNKGLEVIEAHWLFGVPLEKIEVVIHPQSIIHSMVAFVDNSIMAQMGEPKMITPIQYALTYPERLPGLLTKFDLSKHNALHFFPPDVDRFVCLRLAYHAAKTGGSVPCYMNAANEILVQRFAEQKISWLDIGNKLDRLLSRHTPTKPSSLEDILAVDQLARQEALIF